jgi:hypothetical protein
MIPGDHDGADSGLPGAGHCGLGLRARRVDHADQSGEDHFALDAFVDTAGI